MPLPVCERLSRLHDQVSACIMSGNLESQFLRHHCKKKQLHSKESSLALSLLDLLTAHLSCC